MTEESLKKANIIKDKIEKLNKHLESIKQPVVDEEYKCLGYRTVYLYPEYANYFNSRELKKEFLPISIENYYNMYVNNIEIEIKKLEKEFEQLS